MKEIKIGIVTPSYNQGLFLEEAIDSVLSQNYPFTEYVIVDGGSTDNSIEIIKKYDKYLTFWISEPDRGQSHAINKGLKQLRTDIWAYLNSDDAYSPGTFAKVGDAFQQEHVKWVTGRGVYVDSKSNQISEMAPVREWDIASVLKHLICDPIIMAVQVSNFMATSITQKFGYFDESLHFVMDVEFGLRPLLAGIRPLVIDEVLGRARLHPASKTCSRGDEAFPEETSLVLTRLLVTAPSKYHSAILNALTAHQRHVALSNVHRCWQVGGKTSGIVALAQAAGQDPWLACNRPALGLLRRILTSFLVRDRGP